jgi:hypothetical protein
MKNWIFLTCILLTTEIFTQVPPVEWITQTGGVGNITGRCVYSDSFGNVYACGDYSGQADLDPGLSDLLATSNGGEDLFVQKFDPSGNLLWALSLGGDGADRAASLSVDITGNILLTGYFSDTVHFDPAMPSSYSVALGTRDAFILKLDEDGNFIFAKSFGGLFDYTEGKSITTDATNATYMTGTFAGAVDFDPNAGTYELTSFAYDAFILKIDELGELVWVKRPEGTTDEAGHCIKLDSFNNVIVTGNIGNSGNCDFDLGPGLQIFTASGGSAGFLLKLNNDGNYIWAKELDASIVSHALSLTIDTNDNPIVAGYFAGSLYTQAGSAIPHLPAVGTENGFVQKFDSDGNLIWMKNIGGTTSNVIYSISSGVSDAVYLVGSFYQTVDFDMGSGVSDYTSSEGCDMFIEKLDQNGDLDWVQTIGIWDYNLASFAGTTNESGDVFLMGIFRDTVSSFPLLNSDFISEGANDMLLLKFNSTVSITENAETSNQLMVYPNPTSGTIYIDLQNFAADCTIELYDVAGNLLQSSFTKPSVYALDLNEFSDGVYFIRVVSRDKLLTEKIVIE